MITVGIIGTRGIPNTYGGFERFVELLVDEPIWKENDIHIIVYGENNDGVHNAWTSVRKVGVAKSNNPVTYYVQSTKLATSECDIIFCCGVGLSVFAFWPRIRGKAFVVNPDGCEWRRTKWSFIGRILIRMMYTPALWAANRIVIDAEALRSDFGRALGNKASYIGYQAPEPKVTPLSDTTRNKLTLTRPFMLVIARLEPENNIDIIVQAFSELNNPEVDLIIVGGVKTRFFQETLSVLAQTHVRFVDAIYDQNILGELRSNCLAYVHGHSVGGTNPSLIEAISTVRGHLICHDNKYNREVAGNEAGYFKDVVQLRGLFERICAGDIHSVNHRAVSRDNRFHPGIIAQKYLDLFLSVMKPNGA